MPRQMRRESLEVMIRLASQWRALELTSVLLRLLNQGGNGSNRGSRVRGIVCPASTNAVSPEK